MAKDVKFLIAANIDRAEAAMRELQRTGKDVSDRLADAFDTLGVKSQFAAEKQRASYVAAFEKIKSSGVASAAEIEKAHAAMNSKLMSLEKDPGMQKLGTGAKDAARDVQSLSDHVGGLSSALGTLGAVAGIGGVAALVKSLRDARIEMDAIENSLKAGTQSSLLAGLEFDYVAQRANYLGLNLQQTAKDYAQIVAAAKGTSLEGEATRKIFDGVTVASTALHLSAEKTSRILVALNQMMSKGTVQAEELKGQLGEHLPGAYQMAAKAMGITTAELSKQLEQGKVLANDLLPKLAEEMQKRFGKQIPDAIKSTQAEMNRMENAAFKLKLVLADSGMFANMAKGTTNTIEGFQTLVKWMGQAKVYWGAMVEKAAAWSAAGGLIGLLRGGKDARSELKAEFAAIDQMAEHSWNKWNERTGDKKPLIDPKALEAKRQQERDAAAAREREDREKQKAEAIKALHEKGKVIIDIEKDILKRRLDIEKEYGNKLKDIYKERVSELDTFRKAMEAVSESKAERDKKRAEEQAAALRGPEDAYQKYYRTRAEIAQAENDLDNDGVWSPESIAKKLKAYDDLIKKSENLMETARKGDIESISSETAIRDALINRERMEQKIEDIGKRQMEAMEKAAIAAASESDAWQKRIKATEDQVRTLDQMLQNLPKVKEIDINLKINGLADLMRVPGVMQNTAVTADARSYGDYYTMGGKTYWTSDNSLADNGTSFVEQRANGGPVQPYTTYRINEDGKEYLTMGNRGGYITPAGQAPPGQAAPAPVTIAGGITIMAQGGTSDAILEDVARKLLPKINQYQLQRFRRTG